MTMTQTEARQIARQVGGLAVTRDRWQGRWENTYEWGVGVAGKFHADAAGLLATDEYWTRSAAWDAACEQVRRAVSSTAIDRADDAEQSAYDALIEYVDSNDLTYTSLDPRGVDTD